MNNNLFYRNKYLKYKLKYLELKQQLGGDKYILDLDGTMKLDDLQNYLEKNSINITIYNTNYYFTRIKVHNNLYDCLISILNNDIIFYFIAKGCITNIELLKNIEDELFNIIYSSVFLEINLIEKRTNITTEYDFPNIKINDKELSSLDTIFELMYRTYCFFGIENNILSDVASAACNLSFI